MRCREGNAGYEWSDGDEGYGCGEAVRCREGEGGEGYGEGGYGCGEVVRCREGEGC